MREFYANTFRDFLAWWWGWMGAGGRGVWKGGGAGENTKLDLAPFQSSWFLIHNICISILLRFLWYSIRVARCTDHKWFSSYQQISKTFNIYSHCNTTAKDWTGDEFQRKPQAQQKRQDNKRARKVLPEVALTSNCIRNHRVAGVRKTEKRIKCNLR